VIGFASLKTDIIIEYTL